MHKVVVCACNALRRAGKSVKQADQLSSRIETLLMCPKHPAVHAAKLEHDTTVNVGQGNRSLSVPRRVVFIAFYLWMSTQNLISTSLMWARCAEIVPAADASRIYGIIAAAATAGQLVGSSAVALLCHHCGTSLSQGLHLQTLLRRTAVCGWRT
jgi:ATP/ADP translocase